MYIDYICIHIRIVKIYEFCTTGKIEDVLN